MKIHATVDELRSDKLRGDRVRVWLHGSLRPGARVMLFAALLFAAAARPSIPANTGRAQTGLAATGSGKAGQTDAAPQAGATVRFAFGGNAAQIPATFLGQLVLFPASVNGSRPLLLDLDSAAPTSSIDTDRASELGIGNLAGATLRLAGVGVTLPDFARGTKENFATLTGRMYEGTLGKDFLEQFVVELDYARQTAQLHDPAVFHYSGKGKVFPLRFEGAMPVVRAKFDLGGKGYEGDFGVNTAVEAPVRISQRWGAAHKLRESRLRNLPSTDDPLDAQAVAVRLKTFQIGPYLAASPIGEIAPTSLPGKLAGEIGGGMLRRFVVIFDYTHQQMILAPGNGFPNDDPGDMSGISLVAKGPGFKTFEVVSVAPGTPGAEAKIQKGDVIAGVDSDAAADLTLFELRDLFSQVGHVYKLLVERNGQEIPVGIKMRRLL